MHAGLALLLLAGLAWADPPRGLSARDGWPRTGEPIAFVVHGINPVHSDLDPLIEDLRGRGFRVLRFVYDDRADLDASARGFAHMIGAIARGSQPSRIAVVAHSMGGLVSRRALSADHGLGALGLPIRLFTVASPFGGFRSANWARADFGLGPAVYDDLGTRSRFISRPGALAPNVSHVKVETDERGKTRAGESDDKVPLESQVQERVDAAACARHRLNLGHVGSITSEGQVPSALRALLSRYVGRRRAPLGPGLHDPLRDPARVGEPQAQPEPERRRRLGARHRVGPRRR